MVGANPQRVAQAPRALRHDLLLEDRQASVLPCGRQHLHFGVLEAPIGAHAPHHHFHAHLRRLQAGQVDRRAYRNGVFAHDRAHGGVTGFDEAHLELRADIEPRMDPQPWERFLASSANPRMPTVGEAISQTLSVEQAAVLERHLRPLVERGIGEHRMASALIRAVKHGGDDDARSPSKAGR